MNYEDYENDGAASSEGSAEDLTTLARLASELGDAQAAVVRVEEQLKLAKATVRDLSEKRIPDLMEMIGVADFRTTEGLRIKVQKIIRASVPASRRAEAYRWLDENGHGGLIKRSVQVAFDRDSMDEAKVLQSELGGRFENVREDQKVEPSTLRAWIKEQLGLGENVPLELFGAWEQRIAQIDS